MIPRPLLASLFVLSPLAAAAQASEPRMAPFAAPAAPDLIFTLGAGLSTSPDYFGSDEHEVGPAFSLGFGYLNLAGRGFGNPDATDPGYGIGLRGSLRYVGSRDSGDHPELAGLGDVDASYELGAGIGYRSANFDAYADMRYGFGGHESFVGELGADAKLHPTDRLTLSLGPRVFIGSDDYAATYFGVTPDEAAASGGALPAFDAGGGVLSAGLELGASYDVTDNWGVEGAVTWDRFTGDAKSSPIVEQGDRDQYGLRVGVTRLITLGF